MDLLDGLLALLTEREVAQQDRGVEAEGVHVLTGRGVDLTCTRQNRTLCLSLGGGDQVRDAHELEQALTLGVVLFCHADRPSRELLHVLCRAGLLGLLQALVGLLLPLVSSRELARLELWWGAVKDVERLDAIVADSKGTVEHAHQVGGGLALLVHELLAIGSDCDEERVDAHRSMKFVSMGSRYPGCRFTYASCEDRSAICLRHYMGAIGDLRWRLCGRTGS